jgi:hypothetical protein
MAWPDLVRLVITFYLTIAIMGIGFAVMCAGPAGARAAARFFFLAPLQALLGAVSSASAIVLGTIWASVAWAINRTTQAAWRELKEVGADLRWLVRRFDRH